MDYNGYKSWEIGVLINQLHYDNKEITMIMLTMGDAAAELSEL